MPFIDSSQDARVDAKGSGFESSSIYLKSQFFARSVQNDGAVSEDHLTVV